ncbi:hypothetical protein NPIL_206091 [Nephila pilipes]|uniref:Uncharacterized protein n=1 Tax=Nephila pilipes TaxID=299642 RepID=A0A8X6PGI5_NEPPI|nr:hypothetical protein NPIL_206091 [Nephila pilipes]
MIQQTELISKSDNYEEPLVKGMLPVITEERVAKEAAALLEAENVEKKRKYELEKLQLQLECQRLSALDAQLSTENSQGINKLSNFELNNFSSLLRKFDPKKRRTRNFFSMSLNDRLNS